MTKQLETREQLAKTVIPELEFKDAKMSTVSSFLMESAGFNVVDVEEDADSDQLITLSAKNISVLDVIETLRKTTGLLCEVDRDGAVYFNGQVVARREVISVSTAIKQTPDTVVAPKVKKDKHVSMRLMPFYDDDHGKSLRYIIVLDGMGFDSELSVKNYLKRTKQGCTLTWSPGYEVDAGMPFRDKQSIDDLKAFCEANRIKLVITPSG